MLKDPTLISPDRLGRGFILKYEETDLAKRSGLCDACGEIIDITDGPKYVRMQLRTEGFQLAFHENCYEYIFTGMSKFYETFILPSNMEKPLAN